MRPCVIFSNVHTSVDEARVLFREKYAYFNTKGKTSQDKTRAAFFGEVRSQGNCCLQVGNKDVCGVGAPPSLTCHVTLTTAR